MVSTKKSSTKTKSSLVAADDWLNGLIHQSAAFHARVDEALATINVTQDLIALRESRGLTQSQLAERLGITQSAIAQLESATATNVELRTLVRVATALGASVDVSIRARPQIAAKVPPLARARSKKAAASRASRT